MNHHLCEVIFTKAHVKNKEPVVVGYLYLQYAKLRMLELYCNLLDKLSDINNCEEMEMDTSSHYLTLAEKLTGCIRPEMKADWEKMQYSGCDDSSDVDA